MYQLNEKIRDLKPYDPISGDYAIRLDANESFLPLPDSVLAEMAEAVQQIPYNPLSRSARIGALPKLCRGLLPAPGTGYGWERFG